jgi:D-sedoheptulose 7-phosphate isomerase
MTVEEYLHGMDNALLLIDTAKIVHIIELMIKARGEGATVYTFGNGGSGSTASHFAGDLAKACNMRAFCLNDSVPLVTAWSNDADYKVVFERQLDRLIKKGDVVFAISGSGKSPNIIRGLQLAKTKGAVTIGLTAFDGGVLKDVASVSLVAPVKNMEQAEDLHLMVCHILKTALVVK